jgi:hypothetical protein
VDRLDERLAARAALAARLRRAPPHFLPPLRPISE